MNVAIQDANIIIDLLDIGLFSQTFELEICFHTSHFVLSEINKEQRQFVMPLVKEGLLKIDNAGEQEIIDIYNLSNRVKALSVADCSVFLLAERLRATILTGDGYLRRYSTKHDIEVHGILWIFDQLLESNVISKSSAINKLLLLIDKNSRLPKSECEKRIKSWTELI